MPRNVRRGAGVRLQPHEKLMVSIVWLRVGFDFDLAVEIAGVSPATLHKIAQIYPLHGDGRDEECYLGLLRLNWERAARRPCNDAGWTTAHRWALHETSLRLAGAAEKLAERYGKPPARRRARRAA